MLYAISSFATTTNLGPLLLITMNLDCCSVLLNDRLIWIMIIDPSSNLFGILSKPPLKWDMD